MTGDLSLVDTDDLIEELKKRHDAGLICMLRHRHSEQEERYTEYWGSAVMAVGLAEYAKHRIVNQMDRESDKQGSI